MSSRILSRTLSNFNGAALRRRQPTASSSSLLKASLSTTPARHAAPTEDEMFESGRPTPEQKAQMYAEIQGLSLSEKSSSGTGAAAVGRSPLDVNTVEDIHHLSAEEALAETGTRRDATLRHFTGTFS